jgi:hypothetical protein
MNATASIAPASPQTVTPEPEREREPQRIAIPSDGCGAAEPQHMRALERANQVRLARAELKRRVAAGETGVAEVIVQCPWEAASMAVGDLLMSQRRWGQTRCRKFLAQIPMSEQKTIGSMTERQRGTLAAMLSPGGTVSMPAPSPWIAARPMQVGALRAAG